jgi:hypothetical protein
MLIKSCGVQLAVSADRLWRSTWIGYKENVQLVVRIDLMIVMDFRLSQ